MSKPNIVTARLDDATLAALDALAERTERSRAWLVGKAIGKYVEEETKFLDFVQEGADAIERGDYVTHEELVAELEALMKDGSRQAA